MLYLYRYAHLIGSEEGLSQAKIGSCEHLDALPGVVLASLCLLLLVFCSYLGSRPGSSCSLSWMTALKGEPTLTISYPAYSLVA